MSANVVNLAINQGETFSQQITLNPVIDLTGGVGVCQIRAKANASSPILASPAVTLTGTPTDGKVTLSLTAAETLEIPVSGDDYNDKTTYVYDVKMTISGVTTRILNGSAVISPSVTR